jgi:hypothetical protein
MRRIISVVVVAALLMALAPTAAFAGGSLTNGTGDTDDRSGVTR